MCPIYDFKCPACNDRWEELLPYEERDNAKCPECGHPAERLVSQCAVKFVGGGWPGEEIKNSKPKARPKDYTFEPG